MNKAESSLFRSLNRKLSKPMIFTETKLSGAFIIDPKRIDDERGFFARTWCQREFVEHGLSVEFSQCNVSFNIRCGTLRGMHYQIEPHPEIKLVRCTAGAIYDVIVDLRPASPTFKQWVAVELTARNQRALYIPAGMAHGFQTIEDESEVFYQMSEFYYPDLARGVRWDDPVFGIVWPIKGKIISKRDQALPFFEN